MFNQVVYIFIIAYSIA